MSTKAKEEDLHRKQEQQTDFLLQQVKDVRKNHKKLKQAWKTTSNSLYKKLKISTDSYNRNEHEYQLNRQEIRMETHDDSTLIKDLESSIAEAETIEASLLDKVRFSRKLESERRRMIQDRVLLLKDLCSEERIKYKRKLNTLPSFIEVPHQKGKKVDNIISRIRHKMFKSNGKMRKRSPDLYTRRESHIQQQMRKASERKNRLHSTSRKNIEKSSNLSSEAFFRPSNVFTK